MRLNVWAIAYALIAVALVAVGVWQDDLTWSAAGVVFAIFAHAES